MVEGLTIGLATIGQLREIYARPSRALIESSIAGSPPRHPLLSIFDEYYPDLLFLFYHYSLLSPVKRQEQNASIFTKNVSFNFQAHFLPTLHPNS
jgi:hypothetical protein